MMSEPSNTQNSSESVAATKVLSDGTCHRFKNKAAIVTGAGSGIGRAIVLRLVEEGACILGIDLNEAGLKETANLSSNPEHVSIAVLSITDEQGVTEKVNEFVTRQGRLDVLVNMAAIISSAHSADATIEDFKRIIDTNLIGTFLMCRVCIPHLLETKGNIVNGASTAGLHGHPYMAAYAASKGGVIALTKSLSREYILQGVRVNAVAPGGTLTPFITSFQFPQNINPHLLGSFQLVNQRMGDPCEIAAVVAMLASEDASFINGEVIHIDGGLHA